MAQRRERCSLCTGPFAAEVDALITQGATAKEIELEFRESGRSLKQETVRRHIVRHVEPAQPGAIARLARKAVAQQVTAQVASSDFAQLVHAKAAEALEDGLIRVTTRDGLAAAAILDRRAEKAEDRKFMLNLAQLLSGGGVRAPEELIEGDFVEVENKLLAPPELRGDLP